MHKALMAIMIGFMVLSFGIAYAGTDSVGVSDTVSPVVTHNIVTHPVSTTIVSVTDQSTVSDTSPPPTNNALIPISSGNSMSTIGSIDPYILAAFLLGGILWSTSGYLKNWRAHVQFVNANPKGTVDPNWTGIDREGLRDDILLGLGIGVVAVFTGSAVNLPPITDSQSFGSAVVSAMGLVALVDKTIVGTVLNR